MATDDQRVITASELGEFAFCRRSWWLGHVRGLAPANQACLAQGWLLHQAHGRRAQRAALLRRCGAIGLAVGLLLAGAGILLLFGTAGGGV